jgi:hypothetical protein
MIVTTFPVALQINKAFTQLPAAMRHVVEQIGNLLHG